MTSSERVVAGRYRLMETLGKGGMGTVWRAEHIELGSKVAVKLIDGVAGDASDALGRFKREAKAAAALNSAHVVQIFDYGIDDGLPFIAMELMEGESLGERLDRTGTISPVDTVRVLTHAARALDKAHEAGIVHRDLKPDNIFLTKGDDGQFTAKLLDFGVAKAKTNPLQGGPSSNTCTGALVGSPCYMSPEQVRHTKEVDHRTDLWALGVIAYECLLGSRPFDSDALGDLLILICTEDVPTPSKVGPVPEGFDDWFKKACSRKPDGRFQSAKEMADALRVVVFGKGENPNGEAVNIFSNSTAPRTASKLEGTTPGVYQTGAFLTESGDLESPPQLSSKVVVVVASFFAVLIITVGIGSFLSGKAATENAFASPESAGLVRGAFVEPDAAASATAPAVTESRKDPLVELADPEDPEDAAPPNATATKTAPPRTTRTAKPASRPASTAKPPSTPETSPPVTTAAAKPPSTAPAGTTDYGF